MTTPQLISFQETFTTDSIGVIDLTGALNVEQFSTVNLCIIQFPAQTGVSMNVTCQMGSFTAAPILADTVGFFPLTQASNIHTFGVVSPEFKVALTQGQPNTAVPVQAWLFLH
jgi:hypothetical protein